jgi:FkbM family methyltransferase
MFIRSKALFFSLFKRLSGYISGRGFARLPFATTFYQFLYKHLRPTGIVEVEVMGSRLFVNSHDTGSAPYLIMHGEWDPPQTDIIKALLKEKMVFVDIGANIGYFSLLAAGIVGETGKVIAFEPDVDNYALLMENIETNSSKNIIPVRKAVSDNAGKASFYLKSENLSAHSLVKEKDTTVVEVETVTLDDFLGDDLTAHVIKIDVEGAEPLVWKGMQKTISANKKCAIITEFYPNAIVALGYSPAEYLYNIVRAGFVLYRLGEKSGEAPSIIRESMIPEISKTGGEKHLMNILCLKNCVLPNQTNTG